MIINDRLPIGSARMRIENRRTYTFDVFSWRNRTRISANRGEAPSEDFQYVPAMSRCAIVRGRSTPSTVSRHVYLVAHFHGNIIILRLSTTDTLNLACQTRGFASDEKPLSLERNGEQRCLLSSLEAPRDFTRIVVFRRVRGTSI